MQRLGEVRALAVLGVEHLDDEPVAVRRQARDLGRPLVGDVLERHEIVAAPERVADVSARVEP